MVKKSSLPAVSSKNMGEFLGKVKRAYPGVISGVAIPGREHKIHSPSKGRTRRIPLGPGAEVIVYWK
jgi:hypothetical protein